MGLVESGNTREQIGMGCGIFRSLPKEATVFLHEDPDSWTNYVTDVMLWGWNYSSPALKYRQVEAVVLGLVTLIGRLRAVRNRYT